MNPSSRPDSIPSRALRRLKLVIFTSIGLSLIQVMARLVLAILAIIGIQANAQDDLQLIKRLHQKATASAKNSKFKNYTVQYRSTNYDNVEREFSYEMVPIKSGSYLMGSSEAKASLDESPQRKVKLAPFWMGKFEVTWEMYDDFSITNVPRQHNGQPKQIEPGSNDEFMVSKPTIPYTHMDFGMGKGGFPAVNMTQHAASKFCQWLSAKTGHYYRLPTEAEWAYRSSDS